MKQECQPTDKPATVKAHIPLVLYLIYAFVALPYAIYPTLYAAGLFSGRVGAIIGSAFSNILPLVLYLLFSKQRPKAVLPPARLGLKNAAYVAVITIAGVFAIRFLAMGHFNALFGEIVPESFDMPTFGDLFINILVFGIITATFEELWHRGPICAEYQRRGVSMWKIALLSGLLFGIVHSGLFQITYTAFFGALWAFMLYCTRSIWAPILAHVLFNSLWNIINPIYYIRDYSVYWNILQNYVLALGIAALVMLPIAVVCIVKLVKNNPTEKEASVNETQLFKLGYWGLIGVMFGLAVYLIIFF